MPNDFDIPDAPWIRDAEVYGADDDLEEELEFWETVGGPIPYSVLARLNGGGYCLTDERDYLEDR